MTTLAARPALTLMATTTSVTPGAPGRNTTLELVIDDPEAARQLGLDPLIEGVLVAPMHAQLKLRRSRPLSIEVAAVGPIATRQTALVHRYDPLLQFRQPVTADDARQLRLRITVLPAA